MCVLGYTEWYWIFWIIVCISSFFFTASLCFALAVQGITFFSSTFCMNVELDSRRYDIATFSFLLENSPTHITITYDHYHQTWTYFLSAELFPLDARAELTGVANCFGNLSIFLVVKTFPTIRQPQNLGLSDSYILYAFVCALNVIFGLFILPETKGNHLEDTNKEFEEEKPLNEKAPLEIADGEKCKNSKNCEEAAWLTVAFVALQFFSPEK